MARWHVPGYTELKPLGAGGFGEVVLARHDASGTLVAIKYLRGDLLADPEFARMFRAEAELLGAVTEENVVRLYEYVEAQDGAAIVMELVDGVSLREILARQGSTTAEAALVVLRGSLLGLAAAHQRGVVHRDYKPENVLVSGDGASKLTDFGIAARSGDRPMPAGTLRYAAPEQFTGAPATPATDVYAATVTFYECLTGGPPFTGSTEELLYKHQHEPVPVDLVPDGVRPLVQAGMRKDPRQRPADAGLLVTELDAVAAGNYGTDWYERGRSHLGEAALALAMLWPRARPPATEGFSLYRIRLFERRHLRAIRIAAVGVVVAAVGAAGVAVAVTGSGTPTHQTSLTHPVPLSSSSGVLVALPSTSAASSHSASPSASASPSPSVPLPSTGLTSAPPSSSAASPSPSPSHSPSHSPSPSPSKSPSPGVLSLTPATQDLGACATTGTLTAAAAGGALTWQAASNVKAVTVSPAGPASLSSGQSASLTAAVNRVAQQHGTATITVTTADGQKQQATVSWEQSWALSTSTLTFGSSTGTTQAFQIIPAAACGLSYTVASSNAGVALRPTSGTLTGTTPSSVNVIITSAAGSQGSATLTITTSDGQFQYLSVSWSFPIIG